MAYDYSVMKNQKNSDVLLYRAKISNSDQFLDEIAELDKHLNGYTYNYTVNLFKTGYVPDWQVPKDNLRKGGNFTIFFSFNIHAFRTFCALSALWLNGEISFSNNIEGILVAIKSQTFSIQIWTDDGFCLSSTRRNYEALYDYLKEINGNQIGQYTIEYHVHPTYKIFDLKPTQVKERSMKINSFKKFIDSMDGHEQQDKQPLAPFNLQVACLHKRSWKERRMTSSTNGLST